MERNRFVEQVQRYVENMKTLESLGENWNKRFRKDYKPTILSKEHLEVLQRFDENCKLENFTLETRKCYLIGLRHLLSDMKKPIEQITKDDLKGYLSNMNFKPKTIQVRKTIIKYFFKWYYKTENKYPDVVSWINTSMSRKDYKRLPKDNLLTQEEVLKIANASMNSRDKALILVLYESGCRVGELLGIRIRDVSFDEYGVRLKLSGKTGERVVRLLNNEASVFALKEWLNNHPHKDNSDAPLFVNLANGMHGDFIGKNYIGSRIRSWSRVAGINKRVYPHLFRHSRLTELAKKGYNESFLRKFAGWEGDSRMADIYISLSSRDIDDVMFEKEGIKKANETNGKVLVPIICVKCNSPNSPTNKFCVNCAMPLDVKSMEEMKAESMIKKVILDNPKIMELIEASLKESK